MGRGRGKGVEGERGIENKGTRGEKAEPQIPAFIQTAKMIKTQKKSLFAAIQREIKAAEEATNNMATGNNVRDSEESNVFVVHIFHSISVFHFKKEER